MADIRAAARTVRLDHLQGVYRVGSGDWSWQEEYDDLMTRDATNMAALIESIKTEGIREPILLGDDGRVWDGHHRILAATLLGIREVPVEFSGEVAGGEKGMQNGTFGPKTKAMLQAVAQEYEKRRKASPLAQAVRALFGEERSE